MFPATSSTHKCNPRFLSSACNDGVLPYVLADMAPHVIDTRFALSFVE